MEACKSKTQQCRGALVLCFLLALFLVAGVHEIDVSARNARPSSMLLRLLSSRNATGTASFTGLASERSSCEKTTSFASDPGEEKLNLLLEMWNTSSYLKEGARVSNEELSTIPRPPHLENCEERVMEYAKMDSRGQNGERPHWTLWKGLLGFELGKHVPVEDNGEELLLNKTKLLQGPFPPWIDGGDEDNLPMTRRVQRDLWLHQHPKNCRDPSLKFLFVDFANIPTWGTGAQLNAISGMVAVAMNENRVLVLDKFNRADHEGWRNRICAFTVDVLLRFRDFERVQNPRVGACSIRGSQKEQNHHRHEQLLGWHNMVRLYARVNNDLKPLDACIKCCCCRLWGKPWENLQATSQVNGQLVVHHNQMHVWWWRAQAIRYLTRYPSEYLCTLLNRARHEAFGHEAAALVVRTLPKDWPKSATPTRNVTAMERLVWSNHIHRPWVPRPLISVHVRQGDKGREMKLYNFKSYMELVENLRGRFPHARSIWLSTEMQNVVDESKNYTHWRFYFTNVSRQTGSTSMKDYEISLGRLTSSTNAFVNLMMAVDCDYFIGALGSSWGSIIDGLRSTSGKALSGIVSVNPGQFW